MVFLAEFYFGCLQCYALRMFFGEELLQVVPNLAKLYEKGRMTAGKSCSGTLAFLSIGSHAARLEAMDGLIKY